VQGTARQAVKALHQRLIVATERVVESHDDPRYDRQLYLDARVRSLPRDGRADDAGTRHGSGAETLMRDRLTARLAKTVSSARHPHSRIFYVVEVSLCLVDQGFQLRTLERDC
jgi:hypothetical protein